MTLVWSAQASRTYQEARSLLKSLGVDTKEEDIKEEDIRLLRSVCIAVSDRAAKLAGTGLAAVAEHLKREHDFLVVSSQKSAHSRSLLPL